MKYLLFICTFSLHLKLNAQYSVVGESLVNLEYNLLTKRQELDNLDYFEQALICYFSEKQEYNIQSLISTRYGKPGNRFSIEFISADTINRLQVFVLVVDNEYYNSEKFRLSSQTMGVFETELSNIEESFVNGTLTSDIESIFNIIE